MVSKQKGFTLIELLLVVAIMGAMVGIATIGFNRDDDVTQIQKQGLRLQAYFEMLAEEAVFQNKDIGVVILETKLELYEFDHQASSLSISGANANAEEESEDVIGFDEDGLKDKAESEWKPFEHQVLSNIELPEAFNFEVIIDDEIIELFKERDEEEPITPVVHLFSSGEITAFEMKIEMEEREDLEMLVISDGLGRFAKDFKREDNSF